MSKTNVEGLSVEPLGGIHGKVVDFYLKKRFGDGCSQENAYKWISSELGLTTEEVQQIAKEANIELCKRYHDKFIMPD